MRPSFHPRLINDPFGDPGIVVNFTFRKQALLFDLGDLSPLPPGELLKVRQAFVTHTHMDHFIGFDHLLRLMLGRDCRLSLFGPQGFLKRLTGKLDAYTWNLVRNYEEALCIDAAEFLGDRLEYQTFDCRTGFSPSDRRQVTVRDQVVHQDAAFTVRAAVLDHQIPSLAYSLQERFHINILKARLNDLDLPVGPWLARFKEMLYNEADPSTEITVPPTEGAGRSRTFTLAALRSQITRITRGQKMAYVTDAVYSPDNEEKIVALARDADHLFIEAAFLHKEEEIARDKFHLTARQAGWLARKAAVHQMTVFHHSPRYTGQSHQLADEAEQAFTTP